MQSLKQSRKKTLVIFYSYTGTTRTLATETAHKRSAAICEIKDLKRPPALLAFTKGAFLSRRHKASKIDILGVDFSYYDKFVLFCPIWAGNPAPPMNAVFPQIPAGKEVELNFVSGGGRSNCKAYVIDLLKKQGCRITKYRDIKKPSSS